MTQVVAELLRRRLGSEGKVGHQLTCFTPEAEADKHAEVPQDVWFVGHYT
jgi:hypothetical protein